MQVQLQPQPQVNIDDLLSALAVTYQADPGQFFTVSRRMLDSALTRELISELRNEGYVEEQVRGVIRMTPRGFKAYQSESLRCSCLN